MKYVLNLPLAIGVVAQLIFASLALMSGPWAGWEDGPSRGAMAYTMFEPAIVAWLMMLVVGIGAAFTDIFDWAPVARRGRRRLAALALNLLIVVTLGVCMIVALSASAAVGSHDNDGFNPVLVAIARAGGIAGPLVAMGWLAWLIDAPVARRHAAWARRLALGGFTLTTLAGGVIGLQMLGEEIAVSRKTAAFDQQMIDEREAETQTALHEFTDASPLIDGLRLTDNVQSKAVRDAALRLLARRPTLEANLGQSLQSTETYESEWALQLFVLLDRKWSAALEAPLRAKIASLGREMAASRQRAGDGLDDPSYLDRWFGDELAQILVITRKMAESAGVDLRDADRQLTPIITDNYPSSRAARSFPRGLAALDRPVEAALAQRQPH